MPEAPPIYDQVVVWVLDLLAGVAEASGQDLPYPSNENVQAQSQQRQNGWPAGSR